MKVVFFKGFDKDLSKISDKKLAQTVEAVILSLETTSSLSSIPNIKKLKGDKTAYRLRIGNYRLGFFFADGVIMSAAFETRKDIYKRFP